MISHFMFFKIIVVECLKYRQQRKHKYDDMRIDQKICSNINTIVNKITCQRKVQKVS